MIDHYNPSLANQYLNVGIYGCTKAGKTRFLYQLLSHWERTRRILGQSESCHRFLAIVDGEIAQHGGSMPTVAMTEDIKVKVQRDGKECPLELVFCDLRGELLSEELDQIESLPREGVMPTQVRSCDGFLFFFDPTSSECPSDIEKHHQREIRRATMFIEYVLKVRENNYLPIVFVQTHSDLWEDDKDGHAKATRWASDVHLKLVELYDSGLHRLHPKGVVDRSRAFFSLSSIGKVPESTNQHAKVIDALNELVKESVEFRRLLRKPGRRAAVASIVVLVLLSLIGGFLFLTGGGSHEPGPIDRVTIARWKESYIQTKLDDLDQVLRAYPTGSQLPSSVEAKELNRHIRWLSYRLEPDSGGTVDLTKKTQERMRSALEALTTQVQNLLGNKVHSASHLVPILTDYLEDLPDLTSSSPALAKNQTDFWRLKRSVTIGMLSSVIKRRHDVGSSPMDTLKEVASTMRETEGEVSQCKVFGTRPRSELLGEIQSVVTFCEDRQKMKGYTATLSVNGYCPQTEQYLLWRNVRLTSPGHSDVYSKSGIGLMPKNEGGRISLSAKERQYSVHLALGSPVTVTLSKQIAGSYQITTEWETIQEFDITSTQGDRSDLEPLGLVLFRHGEVVKHLQSRDGHEIKVTFTGFSQVPELLSDAAARAKEQNP